MHAKRQPGGNIASRPRGSCKNIRMIISLWTQGLKGSQSCHLLPLATCNRVWHSRSRSRNRGERRSIRPGFPLSTACTRYEQLRNIYHKYAYVLLPCRAARLESPQGGERRKRKPHQKIGQKPSTEKHRKPLSKGRAARMRCMHD